MQHRSRQSPFESCCWTYMEVIIAYRQQDLGKPTPAFAEDAHGRPHGWVVRMRMSARQGMMESMVYAYGGVADRKTCCNTGRQGGRDRIEIFGGVDTGRGGSSLIERD
jgi:hypothetical protein